MLLLRELGFDHESSLFSSQIHVHVSIPRDFYVAEIWSSYKSIKLA